MCLLNTGRDVWEAPLQESGGWSAGWLVGWTKNRDVKLSLAGGQYLDNRGRNTIPFFL